MTIRIHHGDIHLADLTTRMPFKYGIATMTQVPHVFVRLGVEVDGQTETGVAADHLPPKWFTKVPDQLLEAEVAEMLRVIEHALRQATGLRAESPFDAWRQLYDIQAAWGREQDLPPLLTHFGTSLVERAMIEAFCRAAGQPFARLLRDGSLGVRLGTVHPALTGRTVVELLPEQPLPTIIARHTIGLSDPLEDADITPRECLADGLPQSLAACIRAYGLRHFKVKVSGDLDRDRDRLGRVAHVMEALAPADYAFSLDGNEQFHAVVDFQAFWDELHRTDKLRHFFGHLLFVEQPLHRDMALAANIAYALNEWRNRPPLIIDESDSEIESLPRALELGYAGTSHKNCKGVFKGIANACLLEQRRQELPGQPAMMSGEDLVNIGPVALLQDLAVCATLGVASVERNGHHYFAGLSMFPAEVQRLVLEAHGDLYHAGRHGWPTLTVRNGVLQTRSVAAAPFGVGARVPVELFSPLETWRQSLLPEKRLGREEQLFG